MTDEEKTEVLRERVMGRDFNTAFPSFNPFVSIEDAFHLVGTLLEKDDRWSYEVGNRTSAKHCALVYRPGQDFEATDENPARAIAEAVYKAVNS